MEKEEWKKVEKELRKDIDRDLYIRNDILLKNYVRNWIREKDWDERRILSLTETVTLVDRHMLVFRDMDGKLHVMKDMVRNNDWTPEDVENFIRDKSLELWGEDLGLDIDWVNRNWKRRLGSFNVHKRIDGDYCFFRFSTKVWMRIEEDRIESLLIHEMVHAYLYMKGLPYGDDDREFVEELQRVGGEVSGTKSAQSAYKRFG